MSSHTQQTFSLTVSSKVKTIHVIGSWDGYKGQLPLSKGSKPGKWTAAFKFPAEKMQPGGTYWYYYMVDGHHITHDPSVPSVKEKTQGRMMNKLVVERHSGGSSKRNSTQPITGRSLSPSKIIHPKPSKPYASRTIREADYSKSPGVDDLANKLAEQASLYKMRREVSPPSSIGSSLSSRSRGGFSDRSSPSSLSSLSDPSGSDTSSRCNFSCNLMATYRNGEKRRVSCNGEICGSTSEDSCSSIEESSESEEEQQARHRSSKSTSSKPAPRYVEARPRHSTASYRKR